MKSVSIVAVLMCLCVSAPVLCQNIERTPKTERTRKEKIYSRHYVMEYEGPEEEAKAFAKTLGLRFKGRVFDNFYEFTDPRGDRRSAEHKEFILRDLQTQDQKVRSIEQEEVRFQEKKTITITDAGWPDMWQYQTSQMPSMNVLTAWDSGYSGSGVTIAILDDGIDPSHSDLEYDASLSYDYIYNIPDAAHVYVDEEHGTNCAGVAAGSKNNLCVIGVAHNATLIAVRILDYQYGSTASQEARALNHKLDVVDIYSNSWGPADDGKGFDKLPSVVNAALKKGVEQGRGGKGAIYTWAAGNGGFLDNCNADGYANSQYTIAIAALSVSTSYAAYAEPCPAIMAATYSGDFPLDQILTTGTNDTCTGDFSGTSAATPAASGVIAMMLEANPDLTWRDVQHLIANTSIREGLHYNVSFYRNGAGFNVSQYVGFGLLDAEALLSSALTWLSVPDRFLCSAFKEDYIKFYGGTRTSVISLQKCAIEYIEHVIITVDYAGDDWMGDIMLNLTSPMFTTVSMIGERYNDDTFGRFEVSFSSVHFWGEYSPGWWSLDITDNMFYNNVEFFDWKLEVWGTVSDPNLGTPAAGEIGSICNNNDDCTAPDSGCLQTTKKVCINCFGWYRPIDGFCVADGTLGGYCDDWIDCEHDSLTLECVDSRCKEKDESSPVPMGIIIGAVFGAIFGAVLITAAILIVVKLTGSAAATSTVAPVTGGGAAAAGPAGSWGSAPPVSTGFHQPPAGYQNLYGYNQMSHMPQPQAAPMPVIYQ